MKKLYDGLKMEVAILEVEDILIRSEDYGGAGVGGAIDSGSSIDE